MERKMTYRRYRIIEVTRLRNSRNGNPRYELLVEEGWGDTWRNDRYRVRTPSDASWVYSGVLKPGAKIRGAVKVQRGNFVLTTVA